jgi:hypothetical protein
MQPRTLYWTVPAPTDNALALSQTPGAGGVVTLNGASAGICSSGDTTAFTGGCSQRRILVTCAADELGKTILLTGTRAPDGYSRLPVAITESLVLSGIATFQTLQDFATLTGAVMSGAAAGAIKIGFSAVASSPWIQPRDVGESPENIGLFCILDSGTSVFSVSHTLETLPKSNPSAGQIPRTIKHSVIASKNASIDGNYAFPVEGFRFDTESGTGLIRFSFRQAGVPGN